MKILDEFLKNEKIKYLFVCFLQSHCQRQVENLKIQTSDRITTQTNSELVVCTLYCRLGIFQKLEFWILKKILRETGQYLRSAHCAMCREWRNLENENSYVESQPSIFLVLLPDPPFLHLPPSCGLRNAMRFLTFWGVLLASACSFALLPQFLELVDWKICLCEGCRVSEKVSINFLLFCLFLRCKMVSESQ